MKEKEREREGEERERDIMKERGYKLEKESLFYEEMCSWALAVTSNEKTSLHVHFRITRKS